MAETSPKRRKLSPTISLRNGVSKRKSEERSVNGHTAARFSPDRLPMTVAVPAYSPQLLHGSDTGKEIGVTDISPRETGRGNRNSASVIIENGTVSTDARPHMNGTAKNMDGLENAKPCASTLVKPETPKKLPQPSRRSARFRDGTRSIAFSRAIREAIDGVQPDDHSLKDNEPSLPETPTQLGLEPPPPKPRGLAYLSPARRKPNSLIDPAVRALSPTTIERHRASQVEALQQLGPRIYIGEAVRQKVDVDSIQGNEVQKSLERLLLRLELLQEDLTKGLLLMSWHDQEIVWKRRTIKQKNRILSGTMRALKYKEGITRPEYTTRGVKGQMEQSTFDRTASLLPCLRQHNGSSRSSQQIISTLANKVPFKIGIVKSVIRYDRDASVLSLSQDIQILDSVHDTSVARLQVALNPLSEAMTSIDIHLAKCFASDGESCTFDSTVYKSVASVGEAIGRLLQACHEREECWKMIRSDYPSLQYLLSLEIGNDNPAKEIGIHPAGSTTSCRVSRSNTSFEIHWENKFDHNGDLQKQITSTTHVPSTWTSLDGGLELQHIDSVFERLVQMNGVSAAVRSMIGLLFPS